MIANVLPYLIVSPPLVYALISLWCGRRYFRRERTVSGYAPPVTVIKPVKGGDADSFANFASFCRQQYPCFQIVFAVASAADPVVGTIRELIVEYPGVDIELVIDDRIHGPNYKVCNLMNAYPRVKYDLIIVCDSDIRVCETFLHDVCAEFADPKVGLVTSLYRTSRFEGIPCALESMGFTVEMVPNVMVAQALEGLSFALGASMAVRREALMGIGGFAVLVDYLADDYQLGNRIYRAGWRLVLSDCFVESVMHRERLTNILSRQLRWARTMRASRPGGYLASGITQPFAAAGLALIISGTSRAGLCAIGLLYLVRSCSVLVYSRVFLRDGVFPRWLWLLPLRDGVAFVTWALAFMGNRVRWRGHSFHVLRGGTLQEIR